MFITAVRPTQARTTHQFNTNPTTLSPCALPETAPTDALVDVIASNYASTTPAPDLARFGGCDHLRHDARHLNLREPAVLGTADHNTVAVLIPGAPTPADAVNIALAATHAPGIDLDRQDSRLVADVSRPRWVRLNACDAVDHDFHPELAILGPTMPGAVLATHVEFLWA